MPNPTPFLALTRSLTGGLLDFATQAANHQANFFKKLAGPVDDQPQQTSGSIADKARQFLSGLGDLALQRGQLYQDMKLPEKFEGNQSQLSGSILHVTGAIQKAVARGNERISGRFGSPQLSQIQPILSQFSTDVLQNLPLMPNQILQQGAQQILQQMPQQILQQVPQQMLQVLTPQTPQQQTPTTTEPNTQAPLE